MALTTSWEQTLDLLESELADAAHLLENPSPETPAATAAGTSWQPPVGIGPLPADLLPRATALLEEQRALIGRLSRQSTTVHRQRAFTAKVTEATTSPRGAVYLDLEA